MVLGCGVVDRCTCHITDAPLRLPSRNISPCFCTVVLQVVNVAIHTPSHSCSIEICDPDWRWGQMCDVFDLIDNKGIRLNLALWVACMRLPSGRIARGP